MLTDAQTPFLVTPLVPLKVHRRTRDSQRADWPYSQFLYTIHYNILYYTILHYTIQSVLIYYTVLAPRYLVALCAMPPAAAATGLMICYDML